MDKMQALLQAFSSVPRVIYSHCEVSSNQGAESQQGSLSYSQAGMDRTGEMSGSYYMRYLNLTLPQALSVDLTVESRNMCVS
jgi:hypothetical protein